MMSYSETSKMFAPIKQNIGITTWISTNAAELKGEKNMGSIPDQPTLLTGIGGWEIDTINDTLFWSMITKETHELDLASQNELDIAMSFFKEQADRNHISGHIADAIAKGTSFDRQLPILTAKGNTKWIRVICQPEVVEGKCLSVYGSFQDVDARVKAELRAEASLLERNTILESIGDAFFAVDVNWTVNYWNKMAEKLMDISRDSIIGQNLWMAFPNAEGSDSFNSYHRALETQKPSQFEDYYPPLDRWHEISVYPSVNGLSVFFKDITGRKINEQLLEESERNYSELFQLSPLPQFVFDLHSLRFLNVNKAAVDQYGFTREEFLEMQVTELDCFQRVDMQSIKLGNAAFGFSFPSSGVVNHRRRNGDLIKVQSRYSEIQYQGRAACMMIANDITERLNYIDEIETQNQQLKEISWIQSHVIRAPVARIMGLVELLDHQEMDEVEFRKIKELIKISAGDLDEVIREITDKSKVTGFNRA